MSCSINAKKYIDTHCVEEITVKGNQVFSVGWDAVRQCQQAMIVMADGLVYPVWRTQPRQNWILG